MIDTQKIATFNALGNEEAEKALLGGIMRWPKNFDDVAWLKPHHFFYPVHGDIYAACVKLLNSGKTPSPILLDSMIEGRDDLPCPANEYLTDLLLNQFTAPNYKHYADHIVEMWRKRELMRITDEVMHTLPGTESRDILATLEQSLTALDDGAQNEPVHISDVCEKTFAYMERLRRPDSGIIQTGIDALDKRIGGLFPGSLYIAAGRPGMGKTAFALTLARNSGKTPALFHSLEMPDTELCMRLCASLTGISVEKQRSVHPLTAQEWEKLTEAQSALREWGLHIDDASGSSVEDIRRIARRFKRQNGNFLLIVDYLGLVKGDKSMNKTHQIEEITTTLKGLAKELNIPVVLLSQLNRSVEARDDKRPTLSDLRDSGSIEQDADVVMFLYREEYYQERKEPVRGPKMSDAKFQEEYTAWEYALMDARGKADIIIAKNRQGQMTTCRVSFDGRKQEFFDGKG